MSVNTQKAARMALYAADAECLFDTIASSNARGIPTLPNPCAPPFALINAADWEAVAQIRCDDDLRVLQFLRNRVGLGQNNFFYGFLVRRTGAGDGDFPAGDFLVMVRGTIEPQEWVLDAVATPELFAQQIHHLAGFVPSGFFSIYKSMTLVDLNGKSLGDAATAIGNVVNLDNKRLTVVGHSLGSALATYLTIDLAGEVHAPDTHLDTYVIASPHTGSVDFVKKFRERVPNYNVVNWARDAVPQLPPVPYVPLLNGSPSQNVLTLDPSTPGIGPIPKADVKCNHHAASYAMMLDPANTVARGLATRFGCV
jgi:hypothetical protein